MATVMIRVNGKEYGIACDDGQEEHLVQLAMDLDERVGHLAYQMGGNPGEVMSLLLSGLMMSDEVAENKKEIARLSGEVRQLTQAVGQRGVRYNDQRVADMEATMVDTLGEIASRIEKIAEQVEMR